MMRLWKKKKFWLFLGTVALFAFLFLVFFFLWQEEKIDSQSEFLSFQIPSKNITLPVSVIYRYDPAERNYLPDEGKSWQNNNFTRYVVDAASEGSTLVSCGYFIYDAFMLQATAGGKRDCNSPLLIGVGQEKPCSSQGRNACFLYVYAKDNKDRQGDYGISSYHIDYGVPFVDKLSTQENQTYPIIVGEGQEVQYSVLISDNIEVGYCWLYADGEAVAPMDIAPFPCKGEGICTAAAVHTFTKGELHTVYAKCADQYDVQRGSYLNISSGKGVQALILKNHPPRIISCRVTPTQGTTGTLFTFQVTAEDSDGDALAYSWDFGDGNIALDSNPSHQYRKEGTFRPRITVSDSGDTSSQCSTAWVVVKE